MKRVLLAVCLLLLFCGNPEERYILGAEAIEEKEIWRKPLGRERCLLLYKDEAGKLRIVFADGPWLCLTEELKDRVRMAGLQFWEKEENKNEKS